MCDVLSAFARLVSPNVEENFIVNTMEMAYCHCLLMSKCLKISLYMLLHCVNIQNGNGTAMFHD